MKEVIGVYRISFKGSEKSYIGSSKNFRSRLTYHIDMLMRKIHPNTYLQMAFNEYGLYNISWEIVEDLSDRKVSKEKLLKAERGWIEFYKSHIDGYNRTLYTQPEKGKYNSAETFQFEFGYDDVIEKFKESCNSITVVPLKVGILKNNKNLKFSQYWYSREDKEILAKMFTNVESEIRVYNNSRRTLVMIPQYCTNSPIAEFTSKHSCIDRSLRKFFDGKSKHVENVFVLSALNPCHLEFGALSKNGELSKHRVSSLIRLLEFAQIEKDIVIHVPFIIFDEFYELLNKKEDV